MSSLSDSMGEGGAGAGSYRSAFLAAHQDPSTRYHLIKLKFPTGGPGKAVDFSGYGDGAGNVETGFRDQPGTGAAHSVKPD